MKPAQIVRIMLFSMGLCFLSSCSHQAVSIVSAMPAAAAEREKLLLDFGWTFHYGDTEELMSRSWTKALMFWETPAEVKYDDSNWQPINLPHDFVVEGKLDPKQKNYTGTYAQGIGLYRRIFTIPKEDQGKKIWIEFDGIFRDSMILLNGFYIGNNASGYIGCRFEVSDFLNYGGQNALLVRVDARNNEGWWYEGGGIYRHAWLVKTPTLHIVPDGVFVRSELNNDYSSAKVQIQTTVANQTGMDQEDIAIVNTILDADGKEISQIETKNKLSVNTTQAYEQAIQCSNPNLWSIDQPYLYTLVTEIRQNGAAVDRIETPFGIRSIRFDADKGFFLNGKSVKIKGVCNHQDSAGVGIAVPDAVQYYRIKRLKEMGCNAYRCAHHPHSPVIMQACDELGMLVMDETRVLSPSLENMSQLERLILRDRNHPSVILWCLGNEESIQCTEFGKRFTERLGTRVHELDPTRPTTLAMNYGGQDGASRSTDLRGFNYHNPNMLSYPRNGQPVISTESASTLMTRGIYADDIVRCFKNSYDQRSVNWGCSANEIMNILMKNDFVSGTFVWTGFDYRGEPTPFGKWPAVSSHFGIMDTCGFPKDIFYYYQAWWTNGDVLHILPHWNWPGGEGRNIDVWVFSNMAEVELTLNGKSLGKKSQEKYSHLEWKVPFEAGRLKAIGFRDGKQIKTTAIETTGAPATIRLDADRLQIRADRQDVAVVNVAVLDEQGRVVPDANSLIRFEVSGPGKIIGVGNGNPSCNESDKIPMRKAFNGYCQVLIQAKDQPGVIVLKAVSEKLKPAELKIEVQSCPVPQFVKSAVIVPDAMFVRISETGQAVQTNTGYESMEQMYRRTAGYELKSQ